MRKQRASAGVAVGVAMALGWACSTPAAPGGNGDVLINDTRDADRPPATPPEGDDSSTDALYYTAEDAAPDGPAYTLDLGACDTCHCDPSSSYCFGGAVTRAAAVTQAAASDASDNGDALCPVSEAGPNGGPNTGLDPIVGCNPLPAGVAGCSALIAQLQPAYACYLVCAIDPDGRQMLVYCPSP